jgi:hypothetical protein
MGAPYKRVPIKPFFVVKAECPLDTFGGETLLDVHVFRNVQSVIKGDEFVIAYLPVHGSNGQYNKCTDDPRAVIFNKINSRVVHSWSSFLDKSFQWQSFADS